MTRRGAQRELVAAARQLSTLGLVAGHAGNVSARRGGRVTITPTRRPYGALRGRELSRVDLATGELLGGLPPSIELELHLAVYRARPAAGAIVHTHSPAATAWSFLGEPVGPATEEQGYYELGEVRCAPPAPVGSLELARGAVAALGPVSKAALLAEHGVVCLGTDIGEAVHVAVCVEQQARTGWYLKGAGVPV